MKKPRRNSNFDEVESLVIIFTEGYKIIQETFKVPEYIAYLATFATIFSAASRPL